MNYVQKQDKMDTLPQLCHNALTGLQDPPNLETSHMAVGTRRKGEMVRWSTLVPADLAIRFESLYMDRSAGKPIFGIKSQVTSELLEKHISEIERGMAMKEVAA